MWNQSAKMSQMHVTLTFFLAMSETEEESHEKEKNDEWHDKRNKQDEKKEK